MKFKSLCRSVSFTLILLITLSCGNGTRLYSNQQVPMNTALVSATSDPAARRLDGGFIQYTKDSDRLPPDKWSQFLTRLNTEAGMHTIIIQRLAIPNTQVPDDGVPLPDRDDKGKETDEKFYEADFSDPRNPRDKKATEQILRFADDHGMEVYIGLWDETTFSWAKINQNYLSGVESKYLNLAREVWPLYRRHKSFKGWYLPLELWNLANANDKIDLLNNFLTQVTTKLKRDVFDTKKSDPTLPNEQKSLAEKRFAMSPYFVPHYLAEQNWLSSADEVRDIYFRMLSGTGINILMLQDGVGARATRGSVQDNAKWQDLSAYLTEVVNYSAAFRSAAADLNETGSDKIEFWANLESFEPGSLPTDVQRLIRQFQAQPSGVSRFVTFDVYHYLNPVIPDGYGNGSLAQRKKLYCDYLQLVLDKHGPCR